MLVERLDEIKRLRAGITNKPLRARKAPDSSGDYAILTYDEEPDGPAPDLLLAEVFEQIGSSKIVDASFLAAFIAASPTIVDDLLAEREELQFALALAGGAFEMTVERLLELGPDDDNPPEKVAWDASQVRVLAEMCARLAGPEAMAQARKAVGLVEGAP